jgi:hypothetical protein
MSIDERLISSIKNTFAKDTSEELRALLTKRNRGSYSAEAIVAAQQVLEERKNGLAKEPPAKPLPPTEAEIAGQWDARLRQQIRSIGIYYYFIGIVGAFLGISLFLKGDMSGVVVILIGVVFWLLGFYLRRLSSTARILSYLISVPLLFAFPIGTLVSLYTFVKLTRGRHLFVCSNGIARP